MSHTETYYGRLYNEMIEIKPFGAYMYNSSKIKDLEKLFTPPYDVITKEEQRSFYNLSRYNFIRLILGIKHPHDNKKSNRYTRARDFLNTWIKKGILAKEKDEAIYIYSQNYKVDGILRERVGFIALMRLKDFSENLVLPHEKTFDEPKRDRLMLLKEVRANLSPIFSLFEDSGKKITDILKFYTKSNRRMLEVRDKDLVRHKLWRVKDKDFIKKISELMQHKDIFIADGHHRYEVALEYKKLMQREDRAYSNGSPYNFIMVYFLGLIESAITILPTHRLVRLNKGFKKEGTEQLLKDFFHISKKKSLGELMSALNLNRNNGPHFGLYWEKGCYFLLKLKKKCTALQKFMKETPAQLRGLDVEVLHNVIIEASLRKRGIIRDIYYIRDFKHLQKLIKNEKDLICFLLNPMRLSQFKDAIKGGIRLPHKSTYFYPKPLSGLAIHKFD
jgi:uncharacterized protein (DUF1015 family)